MGREEIAGDSLQNQGRPLVLAVLALGITIYAHRLIDLNVDQRPLFILFILPIIFSTYVGGLWAGLLTTTLGALFVKYFRLAALHSLRFESKADLGHWLIFILDGVLISVLVETLHRKTRDLSAQISNLNAAKEQLNQTQGMEVRLRAIIEKASEIITLRDAQGTLLYASPAMESILGYGIEEMRAMPLADAIHPDDRGFALETFASLEPEKSIQGLIIRAKAKDGRWHMLEGTLSNLLNDGKVNAIVANFRDITERFHLEEQLRQSQKMDSIGKLAGGIAHDFNNILAVIIGYSSLLLEDAKSDKPTQAALSSILTASHRAANLTSQLLSFSRQQVVELKVIELNELVQDLDNLIRPLLGEHIEFKTIASGSLERVRADAVQLQQVILNLVVNARDAMPDGGVLVLEAGNVELDSNYANEHSGVKPGPHVMLAISDTGIGMDKRTQARLFEPFFTTKENGKRAGLGLSTAYGIVKQYGGNILVSSEVGKGSTFKIYLPTAQMSEKILAPAMQATVLQGNETILLVEDDDLVRAVALGILQRNGYQVLEACHGAEALFISEKYEEDIHLLLTDVIMPKMNGRELAVALERIRPTMRVLFMSGYTDNVMAHHNILDEGLFLLQKPFTPETLLKKIRSIFDVTL